MLENVYEGLNARKCIWRPPAQHHFPPVPHHFPPAPHHFPPDPHHFPPAPHHSSPVFGLTFGVYFLKVNKLKVNFSKVYFSKVYVFKVYKCEVYPTCVSSKLCEFIPILRTNGYYAFFTKNEKMCINEDLSETKHGMKSTSTQVDINQGTSYSKHCKNIFNFPETVIGLFDICFSNT